jgi:hypothetical protein
MMRGFNEDNQNIWEIHLNDIHKLVKSKLDSILRFIQYGVANPYFAQFDGGQNIPKNTIMNHISDWDIDNECPYAF